MNEQSNFLMAILLSMGVLLGWQFLVTEPRLAAERVIPFCVPRSPTLPCWIALGEKRRSRAIASRKPVAGPTRLLACKPGLLAPCRAAHFSSARADSFDSNRVESNEASEQSDWSAGFLLVRARDHRFSLESGAARTFV